ncbi:MAG: ZIP family metal transporter [Ruminococcus sp.]|nr:ZIP family metal transporter [Ruminococcus sp.]
MKDILNGLFLPLAGTVIGAACVFLMRNVFSAALERVLEGAAAGVMTAASIWSLLDPAVEQSRGMGRLAFVPAAAGFTAGMVFMVVLDKLIPPVRGDEQGGSLMIFAVTLHNIPEGMAVGAVYAGLLYGTEGVTAAGALALSFGIAVQNLPEGAIISMPLRARGKTKGRAFAAGALSGAVEPIAGAITLAAAGLIVPALPYLLSFAAGAMIYVVCEELIPETSGAWTGMMSFAAGFVLMMSLDVALSG